MKRIGLVLLISAGLVTGAFAQATSVDFGEAVDAADTDTLVMHVNLRSILGSEVYMIAESDGTVTYVDANSGEVLDVDEPADEVAGRIGGMRGHGFGFNAELIEQLVGAVDFDEIATTAIELSGRDDLTSVSIMPGSESLIAHAVFGDFTGRRPFADEGQEIDAGEAIAFDVATGEELELDGFGPMGGPNAGGPMHGGVAEGPSRGLIGPLRPAAPGGRGVPDRRGGRP